MKATWVGDMNPSLVFAGYCLLCLLIYWPGLALAHWWPGSQNIAMMAVMLLTVVFQWQLVLLAWDRNESLGDKLLTMGSDLALTLVFLVPTTVIFMRLTDELPV